MKIPGKLKEIAEIDENGIIHFGKKKPCQQIEDVLQTHCAGYMANQFKGDLRFFHPPNGGERPKRTNRHGQKYSATGLKMKKQGVQPGISDNCIDIPSRGYSAARIELKRKGGKLSDSQIAYLLQCMESNFFVCVCWNYNAFISVIEWYTEGYKKPDHLYVPKLKKHAKSVRTKKKPRQGH